jgi:hypothetical protein
VAKVGLSVEADGLMESLKAFQGLQADCRRGANSELRVAAGRCARALVGLLVRAAHGCGVPAAPLAVQGIRVKSDRVPVVSIGSSRKVGRNKVPSARLLWGSEQGPKSDPNRWAVPPSAGYWVAPTVREFAATGAVTEFRRALYEIQRKHGLV